MSGMFQNMVTATPKQIRKLKQNCRVAKKRRRQFVFNSPLANVGSSRLQDNHQARAWKAARIWSMEIGKRLLYAVRIATVHVALRILQSDNPHS